MARRLVAVFGLLFLSFGLYALAVPAALTQLADIFITPTGLWVAVAARVGLGILLWMAADASRTPRVFRVLGVLFVLGGLALPIIGLSRWESMVEGGLAPDDLGLRLASVALTLGVGAFLLWSTMTRRNRE